jgi:hypothetical protein
MQVSSRVDYGSARLIRQGLKGFYQGVGPALVTQPTYWAFYFPAYEKMKSFNQSGSALVDMQIGFSAGAFATIVTNPLWVLRQRRQTESVKSQTSRSLRYHHLCLDIFDQQGIKGFFRGTNISLIKNIQMAFLLPVFERMRDLEIWKTYQVPLPIAAGISGGLAKIISSSGVYPLDVLRTNMRVQKGTVRQILSEIVFKRPGGFLNLFRGIGWYWLSSSGTFAVMMALHSFFTNSSTQGSQQGPYQESLPQLHQESLERT